MDRLTPDLLLCESCGYDLAGIAREAACPECGCAVRDSRPERRIGSPWQRRPGPGAWWRTLNELVASNDEFWSAIRIERHRSWSLLITNLVLGSLVCTLPVLRAPTGALMGIVFLVPTFVLTIIEMFGIRLFGRRNRWRITPDIALTICAHASFGWLLSAAGLTFSVFLAVFNVFPAGPAGLLSRWFGFGWDAILMILTYFLGLVLFETWVYFGFRRMRFANSDAVAVSLQNE